MIEFCCHFCGKDLRNEDGTIAHLRWCLVYFNRHDRPPANDPTEQVWVAVSCGCRVPGYDIWAEEVVCNHGYGWWYDHLTAKPWFTPKAAEYFRGTFESVPNHFWPGLLCRGISSRKRSRVLERDNFRCRRCGANSLRAHLEVDHIVPVIKGGDESLSNLQTLCSLCNHGKAGHLPTLIEMEAA